MMKGRSWQGVRESFPLLPFRPFFNTGRERSRERTSVFKNIESKTTVLESYSILNSNFGKLKGEKKNAPGEKT